MDIDEPLKRIANPENIVDRISGTTPTSASIISASDIALDTGDLIVGNLVSPAPGVEVMDPTSTDFTGTFVTGEGFTFNSNDYNIGGVNAGVLQWGAKQTDGAITAGAGAVVLDSTGITIINSGTESGVSNIKWLNPSGSEFAKIVGVNGGSTDIAVLQLYGGIGLGFSGSEIDIKTSSLIGSIDLSIYASSDGVGARVGSTFYIDDDNQTVGIGGASSTDYTVKITGTLAITEGQIVSGTYTPTLTNVTNVAASTAYSCQYMRVGSVVTVSGRVDIDPTAAGAIQVDLTIPIASNFANAHELAGTAAHSGILGYSGTLQAQTTNDRAALNAVTSDAANRGWLFTFTYRII